MNKKASTPIDKFPRGVVTKALVYMAGRFGCFLKEMEHFLNNAKLKAD